VKKATRAVEPGVGEQTVFIPGPILGLNEVLEAKGLTFRKSRAIRGDAYNTLKNRVMRTIALCVRVAGLRRMDRAFFVLTYQEKSRIRDKDNIDATFKKFLFDTLVKEEVLKNDGWSEVVGWLPVFKADKELEPGCLVHMIDPVQKPAYADRIIRHFAQSIIDEAKRRAK
jgi:hypothetical protein